MVQVCLLRWRVDADAREFSPDSGRRPHVRARLEDRCHEFEHRVLNCVCCLIDAWTLEKSRKCDPTHDGGGTPIVSSLLNFWRIHRMTLLPWSSARGVLRVAADQCGLDLLISSWQRSLIRCCRTSRCRSYRRTNRCCHHRQSRSLCCLHSQRVV